MKQNNRSSSSIQWLFQFLIVGISTYDWDATAFAPRSLDSYYKTDNQHPCRRSCQSSPKRTELYLWKDLKIPLLDVMDVEDEMESKKKSPGSSHKTTDDDDEDGTSTSAPNSFLTPLPSAHLLPELATPFLYGMQLDRPVHKLLLEEATAGTAAASAIVDGPPLFGHLVWKDKASQSLVGAIGCTAQILMVAPTAEVLDPTVAKELNEDGTTATMSLLEALPNQKPLSPEETPPTIVLCRGAFRFVVKEVVKTIPYPVAIVDEIEDDAEVDDSDMFATGSIGEQSQSSNEDDEEDDDTSKYASMTGVELLQKTMLGIQAIVSQKLQEANSKQELSPLEEQILKTNGITVNPNAMEQARAEEMVAVWEVFQAGLVDDILPKDRKFAVAMMAVEMADMNNDIRRQVIVTRDSEERLRIVLKELDEIVGMARARKVASQITEKISGDDKDLKVGQPQLPPWAKTIVKGTRVEYFWNEEFGWVPGQVIQDPVTVVDEILLTVRFEDGETHTLPLTADDKVRWRPPEK